MTSFLALCCGFRDFPSVDVKTQEAVDITGRQTEVTQLNATLLCSSANQKGSRSSHTRSLDLVNQVASV